MNHRLTNLHRLCIAGCLLLLFSSCSFASAKELQGSVEEHDASSNKMHFEVTFGAGIGGTGDTRLGNAGQLTAAKAPSGVTVPPQGYDPSEWKKNFVVDFDSSSGWVEWDVWDKAVEVAIVQQLQTLKVLPTFWQFGVIVTNEGAVRVTDCVHTSAPGPNAVQSILKSIAAAKQSVMESVANLAGSPLLKFPAGTRRTWQAISFTLPAHKDSPGLLIIAPIDGALVPHFSSGDRERMAPTQPPNGHP